MPNSKSSSARPTSTRSATTSEPPPDAATVARPAPAGGRFFVGGHAFMKSAFLSLDRWTTTFSMAVACLMLVVASALGVFQIVTRFVLEQPAEWSEILIRISLIWMVFMGIPDRLPARRDGERRRALSLEPTAHQAPGARLRSCASPPSSLMRGHHLVGLGLRDARQRAVAWPGWKALSMFWAYVSMPVGATLLRDRHRRQLCSIRSRHELETAQ